MIPDKDAKENKDLRRETQVEKQIRNMKEEHSKEKGGKEDDRILLIEELDSKEFLNEMESGLVEPKYTILESNN